MNRTRTLLATAALALVASLGVAAPANADHGADIIADSGGCRMGGLASGAFEDFWTEDYTLTVDRKTGETKGFVCRFHDLPAETFYDPSDPEPAWTLPDRAEHLWNVTCWKPELGLMVDYQVGRWTLTPGGTAILTCPFP